MLARGNMATCSSPLSLVYKYLHYSLSLIVAFLCIVTFGNLQFFVSKQTLHQWDRDSPVLMRFLGNCLLLVTFIIQHSFMATNWFKGKLASWLHISVSERLVYVTSTCLTLLFLIVQWQAIPETYLWYIDTDHRTFLWLFFLLLHAVGWLILGLQVLLMDISEMVGVEQVYHYHNPQKVLLPLQRARKLQELYSRMRHPGPVVLTSLLWLHPLMTLDRLTLACTLTSYLVGRHHLDESHYKFAEQYFTVELPRKEFKSGVTTKHLSAD